MELIIGIAIVLELYQQLKGFISKKTGGVSNRYNLTPQNSTFNRHGDQAYMEDAIRKAGGATNFEAIIYARC